MGKLADINAIRHREAGVQDRLGRTLEPGDFVTADQSQQILVQIQDVRPQMDPTGPKGHMILGVASFQFFVPSGKRIPNLLLVMRPEKKDESAADPDSLTMGGTVAKDEAVAPSAFKIRHVETFGDKVWKFFGR